MMAAVLAKETSSDVFGATLSCLAAQHQQFLKDFAGEAMSALRDENRRLNAQLAALQRQGGTFHEPMPSLEPTYLRGLESRKECDDVTDFASMEVLGDLGDDARLRAAASAKTSLRAATPGRAIKPPGPTGGFAWTDAPHTPADEPLQRHSLASLRPTQRSTEVSTWMEKLFTGDSVPADAVGNTESNGLVRLPQKEKLLDVKYKKQRDRLRDVLYMAQAPERQESSPQKPGNNKLARSRTGLAGRGSMKASRNSEVMEVAEVSAHDLMRALVSKGITDMSILNMSDVIKELNRINWERELLTSTKELNRNTHASSVIEFRVFADVILKPNLMHEVRENHFEDVQTVATALLQVSEQEAIDEATHTNNGQIEAQVPKPKTCRDYASSSLNSISGFAVLVSLGIMGGSIDTLPDHYFWTILESVCAIIFLLEVLMKIRLSGCREYFCGEQRLWNVLDCVVTSLAWLDLAIQILSLVAGATVGFAGATKITVALRALRIARVIRLVKLIKSPMLKDVANMLVGFAIGLPSLLWTLLLFLAILYLSGVLFRIVLGPEEGQDLISQCGNPDDLADKDDEVCVLHWMYGEEFFGSVGRSMFTAFRFMIGDFSTASGKSLSVILSQGYGGRFNFSFVVMMVLIIFGLFNVITAIFVDATTTGLKHNDAKRKQSSQYERKFVRGKLHSLIEAITDMLPHFQCGHMNSCIDSLQLDSGQFQAVMNDTHVKNVLHDLDVDVYDPIGLFDTFDSNGDGHVNLMEFMTAIMKLRGEPQKNDMIATWTSIRTLQDKVDHFQTILFDNQDMMKANQGFLLKALDQGSHKEQQQQPQPDQVTPVSKVPPNNRPTLFV